jgi:hypothetical protein
VSDDLATHWPALLAAIGARLAPYSDLAVFRDELGAFSSVAPVAAAEEGASLGVGRHWPAAISADPLGRLVAKVTLGLQQLGHGWLQNPNYRKAPPHPDFLANYGYREWLGPNAGFPSADFRLGILVLGPDTLYPLHHHPADEVYLPLGPGRWFKDGLGWQDRVAGDVIHHPPHCGHATQAGDQPLAAIYLWRGEIMKAAEIA